MRHRITIEKPTDAADSFGQPISTWTTYRASEPAAFIQTSGGEFIRGKQVEATVKAIFTVRYRPGYTEKMRVVHRGITYGILHLNPVEGGQRYIEILCGAVTL